MRGAYTDHITFHMSVLSARVIANSKIGRVDIDVDTEMTMCNVLNLLKDWNLDSLNEGKANFPGIDLADRGRRIAVQITATATGTKINHTIKEFFDNKLDESFDRVIVLIINNKNCPTATVREKGKFRFDPETDIWNLNTIAEKAKLLKNVDTLKKISECLNKELGYFPYGPQFPLPSVPMAAEKFLPGSRDKELDELEQMLASGKPVFISGVGGIGKTEIAIQLAQRVAHEKKAYFLNYCNLPGDSDAEAMRETILQANFSGYNFRGEDNDKRDAEYRARMDMLRRDYKGTILVIDNFDRDGRTLANLQSEAAYRELLTMDIQLVFTTRNQVPGVREIQPLTEEQLLELMNQELEDESVPEKDLRSLIRAVKGHTLMVILMAKTLKESWGDVTPEQILQALRKSRLDQQDFPEVVTHKNHSYEQKRIYAHIKALFDVSGLHEQDRNVLHCATLLPDEGMKDKLFKNSLPKEQHQALRNLISRGWIRRESNLLTIHPVIRDVCREELKPTDQSCKEFLWALHKQYKSGEYDVTKIWQMADCMSQAADLLGDGWGEWSYNAALLWDEVGQLKAARHYADQSVSRRLARAKRRANLEVKEKRTLQLASSYNIACQVYGHSGDHEKAQNYGEEALKLRRKYLAANHRQIAASYNNLGMVYSHRELYRKALNYLWLAVRMREEQEERKMDEIANSYNNIGTVYHSMGKHDQALKYRQIALDIRRELFVNDPENPDVASSINNVGRSLHELERYPEALEMELEALHIRESILYETDWELANSYYNVGHTYGAMNHFPEAVRYLENALRTWELGNAQSNIYYESTREELEEYRKLLAAQPV